MVKVKRKSLQADLPKSNKKKVLFLLEAFDKGGIEKVTLDIINHLDPNKYDITVQTFWYGGHCQSMVRDDILVIPFFFKHYVKGIIRLIDLLPPKLLHRLFIHDHYDIEIAASDGGAAKVISGSTNKHSKRICWVHMDVISRGSKLKEFQTPASAQRIYSKFHQIVCVSEACKENFKKKFGNYNIDVVYNPLNDSEIREKSNAFCDIDFPENGSVNFICVGRLAEEKGFDRLIIACRQLCDIGFDKFAVYILGDGPDKEHLKSMVSQYGLNEKIFLLGYISNPYCYIKKASAFLLSSRDESFSLVVGESLLIGTPVLATECCGIQEWLCNGQYGLVMENSEDGIFRGMKEILENPKLLDIYRHRIPTRTQELSFEASLSNFESTLLQTIIQ